MKKAVWITFFVALVVVNAFAEAGNYFLGVNIEMFYRLTLVLGITIGAAAFTGAALLIGKLEEEKPLSGHAQDSLANDRLGGSADTGVRTRAQFEREQQEKANRGQESGKE